MSKIIKEYLNGLRCCLDEISAQEVENIAGVILEAWRKGRQVFIVGNGGSAATASHFACDLQKGAAVAGKSRIRAISLTDNLALITALANDIDFSSIFQEQLVGLLEEGDVVIGISASGNSPDIIKAIEYAQGKGAITIGFAGSGGGKLKECAHQCIVLSSNDYGQVEDVHLSLAHIISYLVKEKIANSG